MKAVRCLCSGCVWKAENWLKGRTGESSGANPTLGRRNSHVTRSSRVQFERAARGRPGYHGACGHADQLGVMGSISWERKAVKLQSYLEREGWKKKVIKSNLLMNLSLPFLSKLKSLLFLSLSSLSQRIETIEFLFSKWNKRKKRWHQKESRLLCAESIFQKSLQLIVLPPSYFPEILFHFLFLFLSLL